MPECDWQTDGQICWNNIAICIHGILTPDKIILHASSVYTVVYRRTVVYFQQQLGLYQILTVVNKFSQF